MGTLTVDVDASASPEMAEWAERARKISVQWWPQVTDALGQERRDRSIRLVVRPDIAPPAYWNGSEIHCKTAHFAEREDLGAVVHEVVHVAQGYPAYDPGWLVEGIADWVRYCIMEPHSRWATADLSKASYSNGYGPAGVFLGWLSEQHDPDLVPGLDAALRAGSYDEQVVVDACGAGFADLWPLFLDSRGTPVAAAS